MKMFSLTAIALLISGSVFADMPSFRAKHHTCAELQQNLANYGTLDITRKPLLLLVHTTVYANINCGPGYDTVSAFFDTSDRKDCQIGVKCVERVIYRPQPYPNPYPRPYPNPYPQPYPRPGQTHGGNGGGMGGSHGGNGGGMGGSHGGNGGGMGGSHGGNGGGMGGSHGGPGGGMGGSHGGPGGGMGGSHGGPGGGMGGSHGGPGGGGRHGGFEQ